VAEWLTRAHGMIATLNCMLIHIVSFKYKADTPESARHDHRAQLRALKDKDIDGVIDLTVGADVVGSPRSYDGPLSMRIRRTRITCPSPSSASASASTSSRSTSWGFRSRTLGSGL
jgi:Stress responsive A/B Barrel Domain